MEKNLWGLEKENSEGIKEKGDSRRETLAAVFIGPAREGSHLGASILNWTVRMGDWVVSGPGLAKSDDGGIRGGTRC